ncbi:hypothetical protein BB542_04280 [Escherichia coli]|uniref:hypothetical protein n=1 Tax=Escherichia coli TaxID=562 RepID=UPI0007E8808D|nr:hypothetical protein [Escherichia coli]VUX26041.1 Uncharacterised protein [Escherichia fergusonii]HDR9860742.1 hypothetical protein [Escherichia coli O10 str. Bi8337-41]EEW2544562.1 hypothetical protein [Escherichia coli]EFB4449793.1 hypothetical protein [Escherichia coli]EFH3882246.1 hypothetical protein [Escherichia coli]
MLKCPVCFSHPVALPHGVCQTCYNRLKAWHYHSNNYWKESWETCASPRLSALYVAVMIVDAAGESQLATRKEKEWHLRRLSFVSDCIDHLDDTDLFPLTRSEVNTCKKIALDYWYQPSCTKTLDEISRNIDKMLKIQNPSDRDAKTLISLMASSEENLDFLWWQFIESSVDCIENKLNEEIWLCLFNKHFSPELQRWAQQQDNQYELYFH